MKAATLGFRAKTGRAIAVVLAGTAKAPEFVTRREVSLVDSGVPDTAQPYHAVMELPWGEAMVAVKPLVMAIERAATSVLRAFVQELTAQGFEIAGVGIVGAPDKNLEKMGNEHIRAHAAEGVLFRRALEVAAEGNELRHRAFDDKTLQQDAAMLKDLGRIAGPPWRADERAAATAAWHLL